MTTTAPSPSGRWIYGPIPDLLLGCGLWYLLTFVALAIAGPAIRQGGAGFALPFLTLIFGTPHYGATILRVYEHRADRRGYAFFSIWATAALVLLFAFGVHDALIGSLILTVYLTWSPWHYTGQNYGIAVMFLRRRGVSLDPSLKRWVYASFILSYVLTFVAMHTGGSAREFVPLDYEGAGYGFVAIGIPTPWGDYAFTLAAIAYGVTTLVAASRLLRRASPRVLLPVGILALIQALWFSIPLLVRTWSLPLGLEPWVSEFGTYYFLWIAIGHSVQYLWITSYYAKGSGHWSGGMRYGAKAMLAGAGVWVLPALVFAPNWLGRLPFDAGLGILAAATVNLHHFVLDGAIWKLRDGRVAQVLLRAREKAETSPESPAGRRNLVAPVIWATATACTALLFWGKWERDVEIPRAVAQKNWVRAESGLDRLAAAGRDSASMRTGLGKALLRADRREPALRQYQRAVDLQPTVANLYALGSLHAADESWQPALAAYDSALAIAPDTELVLYQAGLAWLALDRPARARKAFARAVELNPDRKINQTMLERADTRIRERGDASPAS